MLQAKTYAHSMNHGVNFRQIPGMSGFQKSLFQMGEQVFREQNVFASAHCNCTAIGNRSNCLLGTDYLVHTLRLLLL